MHSIDLKIDRWLKERTVYIIAIIISLLLHLILLLYVNRAKIFSIDLSRDNNNVNDEITLVLPEDKPETPPMSVVENMNFNELSPENSNLLSDRNSRAANEQLTDDQRNQPLSEGNVPLANLANDNQRFSQLAQSRHKQFSKSALVGEADPLYSRNEDFGQNADQEARADAGNQDMTNQMMHQKDFSADLVGDISLSTYAWEWAPYINSFKRKLYTVWFAPPAYTQLGLIYGYTIIRFTISKDGKLLEYKVLEHQGHESLRTSSVNAIKSSFPFKPLPVEFPDKTLTITARLIYPNLREWRR